MKEIQTNGITILLVEATENQINDILVHSPLIVKDVLRIGMTGIKLPSGQYQILGKSTELSDEQMKEICEECFGKYLDYKNPNLMGEAIAVWETVQQSYLSLLEANGIVDRDRNMIDKPNESDILEDCEDWVYARAKYQSLLEQWQEAQSKVKHYLVLKRI